MKMLGVAFCSLFLCAASMANPRMPNLCYETVDGDSFCTEDHLGDVQVFVYNAGWCGPCNVEMSQLPDVYSNFEGEPVTFASLSGEGWERGAQPDATFLQSWQEKHHINFVVAGKFRDFGKAFGSTGSIPFSVIVDPSGAIYKKGGMSAQAIGTHVRHLLDQR